MAGTGLVFDLQWHEIRMGTNRARLPFQSGLQRVEKRDRYISFLMTWFNNLFLANRERITTIQIYDRFGVYCHVRAVVQCMRECRDDALQSLALQAL
jgi:hypothetical protein